MVIVLHGNRAPKIAPNIDKGLEFQMCKIRYSKNLMKNGQIWKSNARDRWNRNRSRLPNLKVTKQNGQIQKPEILCTPWRYGYAQYRTLIEYFYKNERFIISEHNLRHLNRLKQYLVKWSNFHLSKSRIFIEFLRLVR